MQNTKFNLTVALTATLTTNILNPPAASGGVGGGSAGQVIYVSQMRVANKTGSAGNFTLYKGATGANAAGTEIAVAKNVPANDWVDMFFAAPLKLTTADFLVGGANALTTLVITITGEIGVAG